MILPLIPHVLPHVSHSVATHEPLTNLPDPQIIIPLISMHDWAVDLNTIMWILDCFLMSLIIKATFFDRD